MAGGLWDIHRVINSCAWQVPDMPLAWVSRGFDVQNATAPFIADGPMFPLRNAKGVVA